MLKKLEIKGLFGLYNYVLDFTDGDDSSLKIVTGPNGYGKTTLFQLIHALFRKDVTVFFSVPFASIAFHIDGDIILVNQHREVSEVYENSDLPPDETISVSFELVEPDTGKIVPMLEFSSAQGKQEIYGPLELLLNSFKCFFLTDERILIRKSEQGERELSSASTHSMESMAETVAKIVSSDSKQPGIELFKELVAFFRFSNKEMILDKTFGIRFRMNNASRTMIPVSAISSGEKHLLLQLFELIFSGRSGDLVMIDEPALSFHPAWLNEYVSVLEKIQRFKREEGREMQIILATHSPVLIGERWNDTLDLYNLRKNDQH